MKICPIVEGHGEVAAVPVLIRRLLVEAGCFGIDVGTPMRRTQSQLRGEKGVKDAVQVAKLQPDVGAVLVLFDGEDSCPVELAQKVRTWALAAAGETPCEVVVAYREYETWFLAALESLRGLRGIRSDATSPPTPESRRDAKAALEAWMPSHRSYSETQDQPALSAAFDLAVAFQKSRSFRKLVMAIAQLTAPLGCLPTVWPPASWHPTTHRSS